MLVLRGERAFGTYTTAYPARLWRLSRQDRRRLFELLDHDLLSQSFGRHHAIARAL